MWATSLHVTTQIFLYKTEAAPAGLTSLLNSLRGMGRRVGVSALGGFVPCMSLGMSLVYSREKFIPTIGRQVHTEPCLPEWPSIRTRKARSWNF